jgi:uncharacterized protein YbbC (DUF1343 family)/CubicO group peptidase (beta-lactamase class C family)
VYSEVSLKTNLSKCSVWFFPRRRAVWGLMFLATASALTTSAAHADDRLSVADSIVDDAIRQHQVPGAVLVIGHNGHVVYRKAYGDRSFSPQREPMTVDTVFDMASLTKVMATTVAVMQLFEQGKVRLNDPVARYLPEFSQNGKQDITVRQLLTHFSGLAPDLDLTTGWQGKQAAYRMAFEAAPAQPPGSAFVYSDINFIVLGALVERAAGQSLDQYCLEHVFRPLKMEHTRFLPPEDWRPVIAPTERDEKGNLLRGVVHDPSARRMGGVAGHAGVFSTADDTARFAEALLSGGFPLSPLAVEKMTAPQQPPNASVLRGLGWDLDSPYSSNRGELLPIGSFGHTGFTGTSLWIDPSTQTYIVLLTNAVHLPEGKAIALRSKLATAVAAALGLAPDDHSKQRWLSLTGYNEAMAGARRLSDRNGAVQLGIDVLEAHGYRELQDPSSAGRKRKIGLLTNQTGVDSQGRRTIDLLAHAPGVELAAIFSPEHGITGTLDTTAVANSRDAATGIPVYSTYGETDAKRRPALLGSLDAVVVDLQDVGTRFYTYPATLGYFLEAAAGTNTEIIVLDRPNPLNGSFVQGPVSDPGRESFTNYYPVPVRHGMTLGELAQMYNSERNLHARLKVVAMEGWLRGDWFDATGAKWINPSPNMRSLNEAMLYPGVGLVEFTNISVGRGTDTPFDVLGAPWVQARELANYLNQRSISGVRFVPVSFTPGSGSLAGKVCEGVNIVMTARDQLDAPELGIELASALRALYPRDFKMDELMTLLASQAVYDALAAGIDPRRIAQDWQEGLDRFQAMRVRYLIYK